MIDELINILSDTIDGSLVVHRSMTEHPKFKVYKRYTYRLYIFRGTDKTVLLDKEYILNTPADDMLKNWSVCDKNFIKDLIEWIASDSYKKLRDV